MVQPFQRFVATDASTSICLTPAARVVVRPAERVSRFLSDLPLRWDGQRILVVGHAATRWGLEHVLNGKDLEELITADFTWQEGWEYRLE